MISNINANYIQLLDWASKKLHNQYTASEIKQYLRWMLEDFAGWSKNTSQNFALSQSIHPNALYKIEKGIMALYRGQPIQQILEKVEFAGATIKINKDVLIPRPETEELLQKAMDKVSKSKLNGKMLDICTGSGCLAIGWKYNLPHWQVSGIDISKKAIKTAKQSATLNSCNINWQQKDVMLPFINKQIKYDVVLCNPPYVPDAEMSEIDKSVLDFEPHIALFVPDNNILKFYEAIFSHIFNHLSKTGFIFVECHFKHTKKVAKLAKSYGFKNQKIEKDLYNKPRFVFATL